MDGLSIERVGAIRDLRPTLPGDWRQIPSHHVRGAFAALVTRRETDLLRRRQSWRLTADVRRRAPSARPDRVEPDRPADRSIAGWNAEAVRRHAGREATGRHRARDGRQTRPGGA